MRFKIATLGCRNNQYESAEVRASFEKEGFQPVSSESEADICVINTCSVTEKSNYRCRQIIRKTVDSNPDSLVVVVGCYPQLDSNALKALPGVDLILGNDEKLDIIKYLKDLNTDEGTGLNKQADPLIFIGNSDDKGVFRSEEVNHFAGKTKAFLKVQTGCNFKCSFCVITLARGNSRSADSKTVVNQFKRLLKNGFKEISLSGIHLGSYGKELTPATNLNELLKELIAIEGDFRIRLSSLGPRDINDELIDLISESPKICNHLHISLQSGSDKILRLMKRSYRMEYFKKMIDKISSRIPGIGLGADLIAGFPGEGEKEFEETLEAVKEIPFSYLHVFNFSRRKNTKAYNMPDQVTSKTRKQRVTLLQDLARVKTLDFRKSFLGKEVDVLVEHHRDKETGLLKGSTDNFMPVLIEGPDDLMNQVIPVRLMHIKNDILFGDFYK